MNASTVFKTADGGATWNTSYSNAPNNLNGVACINVNTCFVLIDSNSSSTHDTVLFTTNGGTTWATQNTGTTNRLYNINCESGCRIMGTGGSILSNALIVTNPADNGTITAAGTLSFALNRAQAGQSITFAVSGNSITLSKPLPPLRTGANLLASCATPITINTNHLADAGLVLSGRSLVQGIILTNVDGTGIRATGSGNQLRCTKVQR
jgi:photosystem II stability/assembly factor-like uncharacterized protein